MRVEVLGPVSVNGDAGALSPRDRAVLAALAVHADGPVTTEHLSTVLWGADPPASSAKIVQGCVVRLRRTLGRQAITTVPGGYQLTLPADQIDARFFEHLVRRGEELLALDEPDRAAHTLERALALWRGPVMADLDGWDAGRTERERLEELRRDAEELLYDAKLRAGRPRDVLVAAQRLVATAPLRERRWALLARTYYQLGRQADALQTLHRARVMLSTELGLDPGPELAALQDQILHQDPELQVEESRTRASATCPYMGLVPYGVDDADAFFGRAHEIDACLERLETDGVLAVVGPSGSGKSSLVRAGVAARLRRAGKAVTIATPGAHPMAALSALPSPDPVPVPVLVIDQFEEAVALCDDGDERIRFFQAIVTHADSAPLVLALRADWIGALSTDPGIARLIERGLHLLGPMINDDLRAAIEGPAEQAGLLLEPGLVDLLITEIESEPGALPLLSHALRTTWDRREGRTLTVSGYVDSGRIRDAVARTAEDVFERVSDAHRPVLRDLLLRLVTTTADGPPVRAPLARRVVDDDPELARLTELLVNHRLATSDGDRIELAHEAVTRAWPRLRSWLDEDAAGQRILRHLSIAADTWDEMGRPDSELYRGVRLAEAVEWRDRVEPHLTPVERAYLDAAVALAEAERRAVEERVRRQTRVNRRLRTLLAVVGVLSVAAVVAGLLAGRQAQRADVAAIAADDAAVAAEARRVGAQALVDDDVDRSLLLAVEGVRLDDTPDTRANLLAALGRNPELVGVIRGAGEGIFGSVSVSPDGRTLAVYDDANRMWFYDTVTRRTLNVHDAGELEGRASLVTGSAAFHPDGTTVAVSGSTAGERPVRLLDAQTMTELPEQLGGLPATNVLPWDIAYSPDGSRLAVAIDWFVERTSAVPDRSLVLIWDTAVPDQPIAELEVPRFTHGLAFSPNGRQLYAGRHDAPPMFAAEPTVVVYDVATGDIDRTLRVPSYPFALSPDGSRLAAPAAAPLGQNPDAGTQVVMIDAMTGEEELRLHGHTGQVRDVTFSPDGATLASSSEDRSVIVWDAATGRRRAHLRGHASAVVSVGFGPRGGTLYSAGTDHAVLVWDLAGDRRFIPVRSAAGEVAVTGTSSMVWWGGRQEPFALVAPTGRSVLYVWNDIGTLYPTNTKLQVLDAARGRLSSVTELEISDFTAAAWHPDGRRFVTAGFDGFVRIWDGRTGDLLAEHDFDRQFLGDVAYIGDGDQLLAALYGGVFQRLDADTLQPVSDKLVVPGYQTSTFSSRDGRRAVIIANTPGESNPASRNVFLPRDHLHLVDLEQWRVIGDVALGFDAGRAALSPDGARVAVSGRGGQVAVFDVDTGRPARSAVVGHDGNVVSIDYSRDGETIVSGGVDGRVSLWNGRTGAQLGSVRIAQPSSKVSVGFAPDGHTVLAATWDGDVHTLDVRSAEWAAFACDVAGRNLTLAEWRDTFGDRPFRETCPAAPARTQ